MSLIRNMVLVNSKLKIFGLLIGSTKFWEVKFCKFWNCLFLIFAFPCYYAKFKLWEKICANQKEYL